MTKHKDKVIPLINKKILVVGLIVIAIGAVLISISPQSKVSSLIDKITGNTQPAIDNIQFITIIEGKQTTLNVLKKDLLFNITITYDKNNNPRYVNVAKRPDLSDFYKQVGFNNASEDVVYVYPIFTQGAYGDHGFYDYYNKKCGPECLTLPIPSKFVPRYGASMTATIVLSLLNYSHITDVQVDKNPDILKKYHKVIVLHNEYVTKREFDAITSHPNVIYLFPNALYAQVRTDYSNNTFTLIRGHGYPIPSIANGFDWKFDNSNLEYDVNCENMTFTIIPNGKMLTCYPAYRSLFDKAFLEAIKES
ncbi:MAG: hypothetical protein E6K83_04015 [Thaumarchaeota archaeon]|nr:MAG: hypothetical protein E6K83_04015 [Nitrososphaerota archaeon]